MAASTNDKFRRARSSDRPQNAYLTAPLTAGATTGSVSTTTGWATTTGTDFVLFLKNAATNLEVPGTRTTWTCTVSGLTVNNLVLQAGTVPVGGYPAGEQSVVIATPTAAWNDDLVDGLLVEHLQDGTHDPAKVAMLAGAQTFTGAKTFSGNATFSGQVNVGGVDIGAAWASWTPTLTNVTLGTGGAVTYAKYKQIGKTVEYRIKVTLGTGGSIGGAVTFTLPVATAADYAVDDSISHEGTINDSGTARFIAKAVWLTSTTAGLRAVGVGVNYGTAEAVSGTVPMTWTSGDSFQLHGTYEAA